MAPVAERDVKGGGRCPTCFVNAMDIRAAQAVMDQLLNDKLTNDQMKLRAQANPSFYPPPPQAGDSSKQQSSKQQPIPDREEYEGSRHNLDCKTQLSNEIYDANCIRCQKIKKVIGLRRKTTKNGASIQEAAAAYKLAGTLIDDYELTRGETFDKKYAETPPPPAPKVRPTKRKTVNEMDAEDFDSL
jgi:hypothetical protein